MEPPPPHSGQGTINPNQLNGFATPHRPLGRSLNIPIQLPQTELRKVAKTLQDETQAGLRAGIQMVRSQSGIQGLQTPALGDITRSTPIMNVLWDIGKYRALAVAEADNSMDNSHDGISNVDGNDLNVTNHSSAGSIVLTPSATGGPGQSSSGANGSHHIAMVTGNHSTPLLTPRSQAAVQAKMALLKNQGGAQSTSLAGAQGTSEPAVTTNIWDSHRKTGRFPPRSPEPGKKRARAEKGKKAAVKKVAKAVSGPSKSTVAARKPQESTIRLTVSDFTTIKELMQYAVKGGQAALKKLMVTKGVGKAAYSLIEDLLAEFDEVETVCTERLTNLLDKDEGAEEWQDQTGSLDAVEMDHRYKDGIFDSEGDV